MFEGVTLLRAPGRAHAMRFSKLGRVFELWHLIQVPDEESARQFFANCIHYTPRTGHADLGTLSLPAERIWPVLEYRERNDSPLRAINVADERGARFGCRLTIKVTIKSRGLGKT